MKTNDGYDKLRGGYYTPAGISDFIVKWAVRNQDDNILEPSCGDGSFLSAIKRMGSCKGIKAHNVTGVELIATEADKASRYGFDVVKGDFFTYYRDEIEGKKTYDVIVGNPPFIRYQSFEEKYRKVAFELMKKHGFHPN